MEVNLTVWQNLPFSSNACSHSQSFRVTSWVDWQLHMVFSFTGELNPVTDPVSGYGNWQHIPASTTRREHSSVGRLETPSQKMIQVASRSWFIAY